MVYLILPMYNEECSIPLMRDAIFCRGESKFIDRIIAVNDGSTDRTLDLLKEWQCEDPRLSVVSYHPNRGLPGAIIAGFAAAIADLKSISAQTDIAGQTVTSRPDRVDVFVTMDADTTHPVDLIPMMVEEINRGYDIVIASRHVPGARQYGLSLIRRVLSWGASAAMRLCYPVKGLRDYSTNFRAYRATLVERAFNLSGGHLVESQGFAGVVELLLRLCSLGPRIKEVPLTLRYDLKVSQSKIALWKTILGYVHLMLKKKARSGAGVCLPLLRSGSDSMHG